MKKNKKKGFTLIELMTVVIIVGILASVAVPLYRGQVKRAMAAEGAALLGSVRTAERVYYAEHGKYTDDKTKLGIDTTGNKYFKDYTITLTGGGTGFIATTTGEGDAAGITVSIDQDGNLTYSGI
ncbi:MAG: prepilin-type N-terminal cleavage/methylation domain-containing protein, partial [Candidatus Omnitrophica bacterium]|nr:prepilin-type N-terminal cleavage/methylation domain-containing protein [Candidatus Omnitrophota bacterium]